VKQQAALVPPRRFASPALTTQGWYALADARRLKPGRVESVRVRDRRVVAFRTPDGRLHAMDARCPHLGADLALGRVREDGIECAFHGWRFGEGGACVAGEPGRRARAYATRESMGFAWAWLGGAPAHDLPAPGAPEGWRRVRLPARTLAAHPHLVLGNGFDMAHFATAHGLDVTEEPVPIVQGDRFSLSFEGRVQRGAAARLLGISGKTVRATFEAWGATMVRLDLAGPVPFSILFTGRPDEEGRCVTRSVLWLPRWASLPRALGVFALITARDRKLLESLDFQPAFSENDRVLAAYARFIDGLPSW
jgi:nitrite reductase/ring-hydroxylating ferredoxin subunit